MRTARTAVAVVKRRFGARYLVPCTVVSSPPTIKQTEYLTEPPTSHSLADRSSKDYSPSAEANADQPQLPLTNPPTPLATSLQSSPPSAQEPVVALSLPPSAPTPEGILAVYGRLVQRARGPAHGGAASAQSKIAIEGAVAVLEGDVRNELEQLILRSGYQS